MQTAAAARRGWPPYTAPLTPTPPPSPSQATFLYGGLLRELAHQQLADMLGLSKGATVGGAGG
jgi:hypothetical protein